MNYQISPKFLSDRGISVSSLRSYSLDEGLCLCFNQYEVLLVVTVTKLLGCDTV